MELLTAVLFTLLFISGKPLYEMLFGAVIFSLLIVILVYDLRHMIIPNGLVYTFVALSFLGLFVSFSLEVFRTPSLIEIVSGLIVAGPLFLLWLISSGRWIGLGDAKLALGMGWFLGLWDGLSALVLSFWIGAVVSVLLLTIRRLMYTKKLNLALKHLTMKTEIPFAPFLIIATLLIYFLHIDLVQLFTI